MKMDEQSEIGAEYLAASVVVDYLHTEVWQRANVLAQGASDALEVARRCYEFVRDEIAHSFDIDRDPVSCSASEVLHNGHGICYAQSHLLAALLRANGIAAGFSYQRLDDDEGGFCLHGFNSVYLPEFGWYRIDARGNTGDIDAQFCPPQERLAFTTSGRGEIDYGLNLAEPLFCVVNALHRADSIAVLRHTLPSSIRMG
jgi:hypothetical protein